MYAQCPECLTFFHLKPSHLKAAGGRVRCSRCKHIFNALETLRDELSSDEIAAVKMAKAEEPRAAQRADDDAVGDLFDGLEYTENAELKLDEPEAPTEEEIIAAEPELQPQALASPGHEIDWAGRTRKPARHPVLLAVANLVLLLLLAGQLVHAKRLELAEHVLVGPYLVQLYEAIALPLEAAPDIDALRISRTDVTSHSEHARALRLTAVLENTARHAQRWPELHVDLQDRWGETVGARYFTPDEYLRDPEAAGQRLPPRSRFAIELAIDDPGSEAVGFQLRPCLRNGDRVLCPDNASR